MIEKIKKLLIKYKELILYVIFGGLTTLVSLGVFWLCYDVIKISANTLWSNIISNAAGIIFAYLTNRKWVFESKKSGFKAVLGELGSFVTARLFTVAFDLAFVYIAVNVLDGNAMLWKLISNVVVIIINYLLSKFIIFRKNAKSKKAEVKVEQSEGEIQSPIELDNDKEEK